LNLYTGSEVNLKIAGAGKVHVIQKTNYPFDGNVNLTITPDKSASFPLFLRIPEWTSSAKVMINGKSFTTEVVSGKYLKVESKWKKGDVIEVIFPMELRVHHRLERAGSPQGGRDLYEIDWIALARGPLVYAVNGLIEGKDRERTLELPEGKERDGFSVNDVSSDLPFPVYKLKDPGIEFVPYYMAGGRTLGAWRLTWIQNRIKG
jgi:DUF1680 family protein